MYIIDRFEGEYAVLEDEQKKMSKVLKRNLPEQAKEGDCLNIIEDEYKIDVEATKKKKERIHSLMSQLFED